MLEKIKAKLLEPKTHRAIAFLLFVGGMACPAQYQIYFLGLCFVLGLLGYALPDGLQKRVNAMIDDHAETVKALSAAGLVVPEPTAQPTTAAKAVKPSE